MVKVQIFILKSVNKNINTFFSIWFFNYLFVVNMVLSVFNNRDQNF